MKCFKLTLAIALSAIFLSAATAEAATTYYSNGTGNWRGENAWQTGSCPEGTPAGANYPVAGDTAYICDNHTMTVNGTQALAVLIVNDANDAILNMASGDILIVSGSVTVNGSGVFRFNSSGGTAPIVRANAAGVDLEGPFTMEGSDGGLFDRTSTYTFDVLVNKTVTFIGAYLATISAPDLEVDGTINANAADVTFSGGFEESTSLGTFQVSHANSTMRFNQTAEVCFDDGSSDGANFTISAGVLDIDQSVRTLGDLTFTGGQIEVAAGEVFAAGLDACPE